MTLFLTIAAVNKDIKKTRENFAYKHFHNILRLSDILLEFVSNIFCMIVVSAVPDYC